MSSVQDPFYIVKEEIQGSIDKLLSTFHKCEHLTSDIGEHERVRKELLRGCESIEWQIDELDKAIAVAARDPAFYGIDTVELEKRQKWTRTAHDQVNTVRTVMSTGKGQGFQDTAGVYGMHRELMTLPMDYSHRIAGSNQYAHDNDDFISSESDRQLLLIKQQDEELDELSASVQRIGHVGLTIHDELLGQVCITLVKPTGMVEDELVTLSSGWISQEKIINELGMEMDSTTNRLEFLQKKVSLVMKKAGAKGQIMLLLFLLVLFIILFFLVFFT